MTGNFQRPLDVSAASGKMILWSEGCARLQP
jgi:hypothetical protein